MRDLEKEVREIKELLSETLNELTLQYVPTCVANFIDEYSDIEEISMLYIYQDFIRSDAWKEFCLIEDEYSLKKYGHWDDMLYKAIRFGYVEDIKEPLCYLRNTIPYKEIKKNEVVDFKDLYLASDGTLVSNKEFAKKFDLSEVEDVKNGVYELEFIEED